MNRISWFGLATICAMGLGGLGCGGSGGGDECVTVTGTNTAKYVANSVLVPKQSSDYSFDFDGNGTPENQLGKVIAALSTNFDVQTTVDEALSEGSLILLLAQTAADATFQADDCAGAAVSAGNKPAGMPDFSGNGSFTVDSAIPSGNFKGKIAGGKFTSNSPVTTKTPVTLTFNLPLVAGGAPLSFDITAARLQFTRGADGKVTGGQLNGVIRNSEVQGTIIPTVAKLLGEQVAADPTSSTASTVLSLFDDGGNMPDPSCNGTCKNPDGSCAVKMDQKIDTCEVSTDSLITNVLGADVDLFDDAGNYKPDPSKASKDSLSLGLGFTAVGATF